MGLCVVDTIGGGFWDFGAHVFIRPRDVILDDIDLRTRDAYSQESCGGGTLPWSCFFPTGIAMVDAVERNYGFTVPFARYALFDLDPLLERA